MKRRCTIIIAIGFLLATGCIPQVNQEVNEPTPSQEPAPTSEPGHVLGQGNLNISFLYADDYPTASQDVSETGKVPFKILYRFAPTDEVRGQGTATLAYNIDYKTAGKCNYQATANVVVSGEFYQHPDCKLDLTLTFNYGPPTLAGGGSSLCGTLEWNSYTIKVQQMLAAIDTRYRIQHANPDVDAEIRLSDLVLDADETGCFAGVIAD